MPPNPSATGSGAPVAGQGQPIRAVGTQRGNRLTRAFGRAQGTRQLLKGLLGHAHIHLALSCRVMLETRQRVSAPGSYAAIPPALKF